MLNRIESTEFSRATIIVYIQEYHITLHIIYSWNRPNVKAQCFLSPLTFFIYSNCVCTLSCLVLVTLMGGSFPYRLAYVSIQTQASVA